MCENISEIIKYKGNTMIEHHKKHRYQFANIFIKFAQKKGIKNYIWMQIRLIEKHSNVLKIKDGTKL